MVITYKRKLNFKKIFLKRGNNNIEYFLPNAKCYYSSAVRLGLLDVLSSLYINFDEYVLIPPICPQGIILPLNKKKINFDFYHLTDFFKIDIESVKLQISKKKIIAIFFIHYFGRFNNQVFELRKICDQNNILLFEDGVHGLLSHNENNIKIGAIGDVSFFSFTKLFPVVDGAIFIVNNKEIMMDFNYKYSLKIFLSRLFHLHSLIFNNIYSLLNNKLLSKIFKTASLLFYLLYYKLLCFQNTNVSIAKRSINILSNIDYNHFINQREALFFLYMHNINPSVIDEELKLGCVTWTGFPIFNSEIVISKLKEEFKKIGIETLSYVRAWDYMPKSNDFKNERRLLNSHLLLPFDERIIAFSSDEQMIYFKKINDIIDKHVNFNSSLKF